MSWIIYPALQQPVYSADLFIAPPDRWFRALAEPVRIKQSLAAANQAFSWLNPFPTTVETYVSWFQALAEPVRFRRLPTFLQQTLQYEPFTFGISMGWFQRLAEPPVKKQLQPPQQQVTAYWPFPINDPPFQMKVFWPFSEPVRIRPALHQSLQEYFEANPSLPDIQIAWHPPLAEPIRLPQYLSTALQDVPSRYVRLAFMVSPFRSRAPLLLSGTFGAPPTYWKGRTR